MVRKLVAILVGFALLLTTTSSYASQKALPQAAIQGILRTSAIRSTMATGDFDSVVKSMKSDGISLDTKGATVTEFGRSPSGTMVYMVTMLELTPLPIKRNALLAFVEDTPHGMIVHAVGRLGISAEDAKGNLTVTMSGPGHATVRAVVDGRTGELLSKSVEASTEFTDGLDPSSVGSWLCFLAELVACAAVWIPFPWICAVVCAVVFEWVCSYAP